MQVYVIDMDGQPLMPTTRFGKVRRMLDNNEARVISRCPFTIRLMYRTETRVIQPVEVLERTLERSEAEPQKQAQQEDQIP